VEVRTFQERVASDALFQRGAGLFGGTLSSARVILGSRPALGLAAAHKLCDHELASARVNVGQGRGAIRTRGGTAVSQRQQPLHSPLQAARTQSPKKAAKDPLVDGGQLVQSPAVTRRIMRGVAVGILPVQGR
jgi:hypothetical protein